MKLEGNVDIKGLWQDPPDFEVRDPSKNYRAILKDVFLSGDSRVLLLRYMLVEGRLEQIVQVSIISLDDESLQWKVGLDKGIPVLRTQGVKTLVAVIGESLALKGMKITASTVEPFQKDALFYLKHSSHL